MAERTLLAVAHAGTWAVSRAAWAAINGLKPLANCRAGSVCGGRPRQAALTLKQPSPTHDEARAAFAAVADQIAALRSLSLSELERNHLGFSLARSARGTRSSRRLLSGRAGSP